MVRAMEFASDAKSLTVAGNGVRRLDLASGDVMFAASGVTDGTMLAGVGGFDLVVANPPYVPTSAGDHRPWADGGPTGAQLPARFALDAIDLLQPGDTALEDGRRFRVEYNLSF